MPRSKLTTDATTTAPPAEPTVAKGWQWVRFGDVIRDVMVRVDPATSGLERYIAGEHLGSNDMRVRRWGTIGDGYLGPAFYRKFVKGQVLYLSRRPYLRKMGRPDFDGVCGEKTFVLEPKGTQLAPELLPYILQANAFTEYAVSQSIGSVNPHVRFSDIAKYHFWLPSDVAEQRRIAELLRAADDAVEAWRAVATELQTTEESLLAESFRDDDSDMASVSAVGKWLSGGTPTRSIAEYWNGDVCWASPKDMKSDELGDTEEKITQRAVQDGWGLLPVNSILIVVRGMILAHSFPVAITKVPMAFNQDMRAIIASSEFRPRYLFHWFRSQRQRILRMVADSSHGTKRLATDQLHSLSIPKLPLLRQEEISTKIDIAIFNRGTAVSHLSQTEQLRNSLLSHLLTPPSETP